MVGLSEKQILDVLSNTSVSEEDKATIAKLILMNNEKLEKDIPDAFSKRVGNEMRKSGIRF